MLYNRRKKVINTHAQVSLCLPVFKSSIFVSEWPHFTVSAALITTHTAEDIREICLGQWSCLCLSACKQQHLRDQETCNKHSVLESERLSDEHWDTDMHETLVHLGICILLRLQVGYQPKPTERMPKWSPRMQQNLRGSDFNFWLVGKSVKLLLTTSLPHKVLMPLELS